MFGALFLVQPVCENRLSHILAFLQDLLLTSSLARPHLEAWSPNGHHPLDPVPLLLDLLHLNGLHHHQVKKTTPNFY